MTATRNDLTPSGRVVQLRKIINQKGFYKHLPDKDFKKVTQAMREACQYYVALDQKSTTHHFRRARDLIIGLHYRLMKMKRTTVAGMHTNSSSLFSRGINA